MEEMNQSEKAAETTSNSVTSPIFNSLAVVTTSTPSAGAAAGAGGNSNENSDELNKTANSINNNKKGTNGTSAVSTTTSSAPTASANEKSTHKIELNIENSRPMLNKPTTSSTDGDSKSAGGSSTLKLFIKRQDFSATQVTARDDSALKSPYKQQVTTTPHRFVQSPSNNNMFGRAKKSFDLVSNEESETKGTSN